jgi:monoamine oxidase
VVIIGAGLSGLRAAKELIKKGITSIKIVEARNVKN